MSRIGKKPIEIPKEVAVEVKPGKVKVIGQRGELTLATRPEIELTVKENQILVSRKGDTKLCRSLHGLTRTLVDNMIKGVSEGWKKTLKLIGTGYRVKLEGENLVLSLGFSHPVNVKSPEGIKFEVEGTDTIIVSGTDKALVGQTTAQIRKIKPPEPYKGKGIRYEDEIVRRKAGKAAKVGAAGFGEGKK